MIVIDASVVGFALLEEGQLGDRARREMRADDRWIMPEHWMVEVMSVIRGRLLGQKISQEHAEEAVTAVAEFEPVIPQTRVLLPRIWELRSNLTSYDAAYVAAAEAYDCPLLTGDSRLVRTTGIRCEVCLVA